MGHMRQQGLENLTQIGHIDNQKERVRNIPNKFCE